MTNNLKERTKDWLRMGSPMNLPSEYPVDNNLKEAERLRVCDCGVGWSNPKARHYSNCRSVKHPDEFEVKEPTIDWLIDEICPNKGNSPLLNFNKKRLKTLINQKEKEAQLRELEGISGWSNITGVATIVNGKLENVDERIKQLKEELKEKGDSNE